jgi:hypothetical protein
MMGVPGHLVTERKKRVYGVTFARTLCGKWRPVQDMSEVIALHLVRGGDGLSCDACRQERDKQD